eukprot:m.84906 g.84906  ORF g.84906 m.84906 type:complete len:326 (-) comp12988_c0_seq2:3703-4680(-)
MAAAILSAFVLLLCSLRSSSQSLYTDLTVSEDVVIMNYVTETGSDVSEGKGQGLRSGANGKGDEYRSLLKFNIAGALDADAIIQTVSFTLTLNRAAFLSDDLNTTLHRVTTDWSEGPSASNNQVGTGSGGLLATPQMGDVTWNYSSFNTSFWTTAGGDFNATSSASVLVPEFFFDPQNVTWTDPQLASDAQDMLLNPSENYGWLIKNSDQGESSAKIWNSGQAPNNKPFLSITYRFPCTIVCPGFQALQPGSNTDPVNTGTPVPLRPSYPCFFSDNLTYTDATIGCFDGSIERTWTHTANNGDVTTCSHKILLRDEKYEKTEILT